MPRLQLVQVSLDAITITITRAKQTLYFGDNPEPDPIYRGILKILASQSYEISGHAYSFIADEKNGVYVKATKLEIIIQLKSVHLMTWGNKKVSEILAYLNAMDCRPRKKRARKKGAEQEKQSQFYQITRLDFAADYESKHDLPKLFNQGVGYYRQYAGIQKECSYRPYMELKNGSWRFNEIKLSNNGFSLSIYNKKTEITEQASMEKFQLYPEKIRALLSNPEAKLFRVELRYFRSRSTAFNALTANEIYYSLPTEELNKFGKKIYLLNLRNSKKSLFFSRLFSI